MTAPRREAAKNRPPGDAAMSRQRVGGLLVRGVCMGLAEVVPGVSGGTVAFVSGIYFELVNSLAKFGIRSLSLLRSPSEFFRYHNLGFLLSLAAGMAIGVLVFANFMQYALGVAPVAVWAFFFGLIAASVVVVGRDRRLVNLGLFGTCGLVCGVALVFLPATSGDASVIAVFFGGMVAVSAWLLPAVSGSFMLLALGLYEKIIAAVANVEVVTLVTLAAGCATGLLLFSKGLAWMMRRFQDQLLSGLTGFMLGSLTKLWPWRLPQETGFVGLLTPADYVAATQQPGMELGALVAALFGMVALWLLTRLGR